MPTLKMPTTVKVFMRGSAPPMVTAMSGEIAVTSEPMPICSAFAIAWPTTMPSRFDNPSSDPATMFSAISFFAFKSSSRTPRRMAPVPWSLPVRNTWPSTMGVAEAMLGRTRSLLAMSW